MTALKTKIISLATLISVLLSLGACRHIDDERIPRIGVYLTFTSRGEWDIYGVAAAFDSRRFIKSTNPSEIEPKGYPYTALSATGYGGILLVCDVNNIPLAYDLACPVEVNPNIRVYIDRDSWHAVCPVCHSEYDVFMNFGTAVGGIASDRHYGLTRYKVGPGFAGEYMLISN